MELTHISLFAGIGGIDIAAEWAGFKTIMMVENNAYCQKVLNKHWPNVPIIGDIKDATKEAIANATIQRPHNQENKQELEGEGCNQLYAQQPRATGTERSKTISIPAVTLITGGFPCQPVSQAGQRRGKEDDRWLWPQMLRVISEVRPAWVLAENVTGLLTMGFYDCLSDLESAGYETISFVIPACGVNAPHRRARIFIVGHSKHDGYQNGYSETGREDTRGEQGGLCQLKGTGDVADTQGSRIGQELSGVAGKLLSKDRTSQEFESSGGNSPNTYEQGLAFRESIRGNYEPKCSAPQRSDWWAAEPKLGRVANGIPSRVDRLKCLGNAVVPQQIYPMLKAIAEIEKNIEYSL